MVPYYCLLGIPALISVVAHMKNVEKRNIIVFDAFFSIWLLLLILRNQCVGVDLINYEPLFESAGSMSLKTIFSQVFVGETEPGYLLLCKILSKFTDNFRVVMIVVAVLALCPIWFLYRRNGDNYAFLAIAIFMCFGLFSMYFSGFRQILAMAFAVPAYKFTREKKWPLFLLMVALAFFFHRSAVVLLLMYPVYYINFKWNISLAVIIPVIALVYIFKTPIFALLCTFIEGMYGYQTQATGAFAIFALLVIFLIYSFVIIDNSEIDTDTKGLRNFLVLAVVFQIFTGINTIAMRMNYYYLLFVPLLIPRIAANASPKWRKIAQISVIVMVAFFVGYYFYNTFTGADVLHVYPYVALWQEAV